MRCVVFAFGWVSLVQKINEGLDCAAYICIYYIIYTSDVHIYSSIKKEEIGNNPSMDEMKFIN